MSFIKKLFLGILIFFMLIIVVSMVELINRLFYIISMLMV